MANGNVSITFELVKESRWVACFLFNPLDELKSKFKMSAQKSVHDDDKCVDSKEFEKKWSQAHKPLEKFHDMTLVEVLKAKWSQTRCLNISSRARLLSILFVAALLGQSKSRQEP